MKTNYLFIIGGGITFVFGIIFGITLSPKNYKFEFPTNCVIHQSRNVIYETYITNTISSFSVTAKDKKEVVDDIPTIYNLRCF